MALRSTFLLHSKLQHVQKTEQNKTKRKKRKKKKKSRGIGSSGDPSSFPGHSTRGRRWSLPGGEIPRGSSLPAALLDSAPLPRGATLEAKQQCGLGAASGSPRRSTAPAARTARMCPERTGRVRPQGRALCAEHRERK